MKKLYYICKFEFTRLLSNWQKTLKLFLIPAAVMLAALYLFPMLVNYLSTGSLGRTSVLVSNAPDSFMDYVDDLNVDTIYTFKEVDEKDVNSKKEIEEYIKTGNLVVVFDDNYEKEVIEYYEDLTKYYENYEPDQITPVKMFPKNKAEVNVYYKEDSTFESRALQLEGDILEKYIEDYPDLAEIDTSKIPKDSVNNNSFNPIMKVLLNRVQANLRAGKLIPQIIVLMMYYCIYSLSLDIFAGDRERGFLTKLMMAPISSKTIIWGKLITIEIMALISSVIIFFMMFLASWLNFSNDALSLLPFGMLMLPMQLLKMLVVCVTSGMTMVALCCWIIFELQRPEDITINLQFPLATILIELFVFMFKPGTPIAIEYALPIHNAIVSMQTIMLSNDNPLNILMTVLFNILYTSLIIRAVLKKEELL